MSFTQREARNLIRKARNRVPEGEEIRHLNIMPMMDMMTILLVAFIYQASVAVSELSTGSVALPKSLSQEPLPEGANQLIITPNGILVDQEQIVSVRNGDVDAAEKEGGATGVKIPKLSRYLGNLAALEDKARIAAGGKPVEKRELLVIADRNIPYSLLIQVMFSAKQKEAGYKRFRLIVQKAAGE